MSKIHDQLRRRRKELGLKQQDMELRVGMARQQYQRLETRGNPSLSTLDLIAKGLKMELMLIPLEKLPAVRKLLEGRVALEGNAAVTGGTKTSAADDPWRGLLEEEN